MFGGQAQRVDPRPGFTGHAGHRTYVFYRDAPAGGQGGAQRAGASIDQTCERHGRTVTGGARFAGLQALGDVVGDTRDSGERSFGAFFEAPLLV